MLTELVFFLHLANAQVHFRERPIKHPLGMGSPKNSSVSSGDGGGRSGEKEKREKEWAMSHEVWSAEEVNSIKVRRREIGRRGGRPAGSRQEVRRTFGEILQ